MRQVTYPGGLVQGPHAHPYTSITLHLSGGIRERARRDEVESTGLSLTVKPAGVVHSDRYGPEPVTTLQIVLEPHNEGDPHGWREMLSRWGWVHGGPAVREAVLLFRSYRDRSSSEEGLRERLVTLLDALRGETAGREPRDPPAWFDRALEGLHEGYDRGVRVADVAEQVGVHPVHLTRCFRRFRGCTVTDYIRRLRVRAAARRLLSCDRTISAIAYETGFSDHPHLTRSFKRETGLTPGAFRRLRS